METIVLTKKRRNKWSTKTFAEEVANRSDGKFTLVGEYVSYRERIDTYCAVCGNLFGLKPHSFIVRGHGCPHCAGNAGRDTEWMVDKLEEIVGDEFTFLEEYKGSSEKIDILHASCGMVFRTTPTAFFNYPIHAKCPEVFRERVRELVGDEYVFQEDYIGTHDVLPVVHSSCGKLFRIRPSDFLIGQRCPRCTSSGRFVSVVKSLSSYGYSVLEDYEGSSFIYSLKHVECGYVNKRGYDSLMRVRIPFCEGCGDGLSFTKGERAVAESLENISIPYETEKTFKYLGAKRFDFFIPSLNIAIEYDGQQHYDAVEFWGGEETLKRTQESDALKNDFCEYMGIDLLRIPYWEFDNIDEIVTNFIDTVKLMRSISASGSEMSKCR